LITSVVMPQMGLEVTEGTVAAIHVAAGARVSEDDPLIEMETDKALTDVVAPRDGIVRSIDVEVGDTVEIGACLVTLADPGDEDLASPDDVDAPPASAPPASSAPVPAAAAAASHPAGGMIRAAPVARRAARQLGVELADVHGTGPKGRVTLDDVRNAAGENGAQPATPAPVVHTPPQEAAAGREPLTAMRRAIARRMTASQLIPQYHLIKDVDATHLMAEKDAQRSRGTEKVSVNDLLIQAIAETAVRHPALATAFVEGDDGEPPSLLSREGVDVGLAAASERGLVVPVIRRAHERGLADIARERQRLVAAARDGRLSLEEMSGGTITLSSLSAMGIDRFTALVNPGESTIVAVGRTADRFVPRGRTIAVVPTLTLTLSFDHRVVDGAVGAAALAELATLLEGGMAWRP